MAGRAYHKLIANRNYYVALKLLYSLTSLQLFLDNEVSKLFTLDSLEQLDLYMAGIGHHCHICIKQGSHACLEFRTGLDTAMNLKTF